MAIDKIFDNASVDGIADNLFKSVSNSVSEVKAMQQRKAAENVQLVIQALKKIESDIQDKYDGVTTVIEKRVSSIKDGRDGRDGVDGKAGKDGRPGRDGATGPRGIDGKNGVDGVDGDDGVSVVDAHIDFDGSLIIGLSSGRAINVGEVVAPDLAEKIKVITNGGGTSQSVLDTLTSLQNQINLISSALVYKGTWDASTNTPTLASGVGTANTFYIVSVAGTTTLNGVSNWGVGDWATFNGTIWQRVEGGSSGNFVDLSVSGTTTLSGLTASTALALDASKNVVSVTNTGTGSNVLATSPTLVTPALGTPSSGVVTNLTGTASININGTVGATTPAAGSFTSLTDSGNLTFTGTGNRITGDFSNATIANRVFFQTSTTNGATTLGIVPNGTGTTANFASYGNSADLANSSIMFVGVSSSGTEVRLNSAISGTGTYLPMTFYTGGSESVRIGSGAASATDKGTVGIGYTALTGVGNNGLAVLGNVGIGTSSPTAPLDVNGNVAITGSARRITGDFTSGAATRIMVQTNTVNGTTSFSLLPNGTGAAAGFTAFSNSDPTNSNGIQLTAALTANKIVGIANGSSSAVPITFSQGNNEQMRIDTVANGSSVGIGYTTLTGVGSNGLAVLGNVGIGTSSPTSYAGGSNRTLQIYNSASANAELRISNSTTGTGASVGALIQQAGNDMYVWNASNSFMSFGTNASERMRIDSAGIVTMSAYGAGAATFSAAGVISSVSDETWKIKDGVPVDPDSMLKKLEPGYWYYNDEKKETFGTARELGFYAQNVNAAIGPEAAPIPEEGKPWGYYDRSVLAVTVMSLQKALATIESLTARIEALER